MTFLVTYGPLKIQVSVKRHIAQTWTKHVSKFMQIIWNLDFYNKYVGKIEILGLLEDKYLVFWKKNGQMSTTSLYTLVQSAPKTFFGIL